MACGVRLAFTGRAGGVSEGAYASLNTATHVGDSLEAVQRNRQLVLEAVAAGVVCDVGDVGGAVNLGDAGDAGDACDAGDIGDAGDAGDACDVPVVIPNQVHGTDFVEVRDGASAEEVARVDAQAQEGADGVIVRAEGVATLMNFGDCLSLVVVSPSGAFVAAHAGWRGAVAGVAGKAVRALADGDPFDPSAYNAYIGPHIRSECFEVSENIASQFVAAFGPESLSRGENDSAADLGGSLSRGENDSAAGLGGSLSRGETDFPRGKRSACHVSLANAVSTDLQRAGLAPERIADCGICTMCHPDEYFSYRASNGHCGRHAVAVVRNHFPAGKPISRGENGRESLSRGENGRKGS